MTTGFVPLTEPRGFRVAERGGAHLELSWEAVPGADGYDLERLSANRTWIPVAAALAATTWLDEGLQPNSPYRYRLRAVRGSRTSEWIYLLDKWTSAAVAAPGSLVAKAVSATEVALRWEAVPGGNMSYRIRRRLRGTGGWSDAYSGSATGARDAGLEPLTEYEYEGRTIYRLWGQSYRSEWTDPVYAITEAPAAPTLRLDSVTAETVELAWSAVAGAVEYEVQRRSQADSGSWTSVDASCRRRRSPIRRWWRGGHRVRVSGCGRSCGMGRDGRCPPGGAIRWWRSRGAEARRTPVSPGPRLPLSRAGSLDAGRGSAGETEAVGGPRAGCSVPGCGTTRREDRIPGIGQVVHREGPVGSGEGSVFGAEPQEDIHHPVGGATRRPAAGSRSGTRPDPGGGGRRRGWRDRRVRGRAREGGCSPSGKSAFAGARPRGAPVAVSSVSSSEPFTHRTRKRGRSRSAPPSQPRSRASSETLRVIPRRIVSPLTGSTSSPRAGSTTITSWST